MVWILHKARKVILTVLLLFNEINVDRYTQVEVIALVEYARQRGIKVMIEVIFVYYLDFIEDNFSVV